MMSDLKLIIEQTEKTENGLDVLLRDKNGKWVGWFYDFETAKQVSESLDEIQAIQTRLAEVEADFDALKSIEGKLMDMEREWRDKDVGDNPKTIARAQGVADGLYQAAKLFKTNEV